MPSTFRTSVCKLFKFEAAHHLPYHKGKCRSHHGHSYKLEVEITGDLVTGNAPDTGMIFDFGSLSTRINGYVIDRVDHKDLNDIWEIPTAEIMVEQIAKWVDESLPDDITPLRVRLWETDTSWAEWRRA